eukprot:11156618-Lingulodinium_polyedra.AAC.1
MTRRGMSGAGAESCIHRLGLKAALGGGQRGKPRPPDLCARCVDRPSGAPQPRRWPVPDAGQAV